MQAPVKRALIKAASVVTTDDTPGVLPDGAILVEDDHIVDVAPAILADDALVVNASGMIAIPGLVDSHT